jgi:hypothetical protein
MKRGPKIDDVVVACCFVAVVPVAWAIVTVVYAIFKAWGAQIGA